MSSHADEDQRSSETRVSELTVERSALFEKASTDTGLSADEQKRLQAIELALDECFVTRRRKNAARDLHRFAPEGLMGRWAVGSSDNNGGKSPRMARYLTRVGEDTPFAYALNRRDFLLVSDQKLWAHESHDWLLAADSGVAFAHRTGDSYYSVDTGEALFTQTASPYPES